MSLRYSQKSLDPVEKDGKTIRILKVRVGDIVHTYSILL
jgi:hypothetical protein